MVVHSDFVHHNKPFASRKTLGLNCEPAELTRRSHTSLPHLSIPVSKGASMLHPLRFRPHLYWLTACWFIFSGWTIRLVAAQEKPLSDLNAATQTSTAKGQDNQETKGGDEKTPSSKVDEEKPIPPSNLDALAKMQFVANVERKADWGHWGNRPSGFHAWTNHTNRLIPVYTFGATFSNYMYENSPYRSEQRIRDLYGRLPIHTLNPEADYGDQTDVYRLQRTAIEQGKKYIFLIIFDGMDWQTTWAASIYKNREVVYQEGRGSGLAFQDYRGTTTDYGYVVTSAYSDDCEVDEDAQQIKIPWKLRGGYDAKLGGAFPWSNPSDREYPIGRSTVSPHAYTDSSSSATSMTAGIKTFNGGVNVTYDCRPVETLAHWVQRDRGMSIGAVTSVPFCHATPAAAYSHNVSRDDYQDLSRDMLGLPSVAHRKAPLSGMDVVIGAGWGAESKDGKGQGQNFIPGNKFLAQEDKVRCSVPAGGKYVVAERTRGRPGREVLLEGTRAAVAGNHRLLGFFGTAAYGHLPFQTANGDYLPTRDMKATEKYSREDLEENPTLADMTEAALMVLEKNPKGFWLLIESGDVDWANHANNIDNAIGAVFSGDDAFRRVVDWIDSRKAWADSLVVVTSDHGHYFHLLKPQAIAEAAGR